VRTRYSSRDGRQHGGLHVFWAFGQYDGMGFPVCHRRVQPGAPWMKSIEPADLPLARSYAPGRNWPGDSGEPRQGRWPGSGGRGETPQKDRAGQLRDGSELSATVQSDGGRRRGCPTTGVLRGVRRSRRTEERSGALFMLAGRMRYWWRQRGRCSQVFSEQAGATVASFRSRKAPYTMTAGWDSGRRLNGDRRRGETCGWRRLERMADPANQTLTATADAYLVTGLRTPIITCGSLGVS